MPDDRQPTENETPYLRYFGFVGAAVLVVAVGWGTAPWWAPSTLEGRGQFGDWFGAVNALFSGLALAGVIVALVMQRKELGYQRKELSLTRAEMELSRGELRRQAESSERRLQFESNLAIANVQPYFQLRLWQRSDLLLRLRLSNHGEKVFNLEVRVLDGHAKARDLRAPVVTKDEVVLELEWPSDVGFGPTTLGLVYTDLLGKEKFQLLRIENPVGHEPWRRLDPESDEELTEAALARKLDWARRASLFPPPSIER